MKGGSKGAIYGKGLFPSQSGSTAYGKGLFSSQSGSEGQRQQRLRQCQWYQEQGGVAGCLAQRIGKSVFPSQSGSGKSGCMGCPW